MDNYAANKITPRKQRNNLTYYINKSIDEHNEEFNTSIRKSYNNTINKELKRWVKCCTK